MITLKKQHRGYEKSKKIPCDWLPSLPDTWKCRRAKTLIAAHSGGLWGEEPRQNEDDILCVRVADFDYEKLGIRENAETIRNIEKNQRQSKELNLGDLLIEKSGGGEQQLVGRAVIFNLKGNAICSNFIERLSMNSNIEPRYGVYLLSAMYAGNVNLRSIKQTTGIQNLDLGSYLNELWPLPPVEGQQSIASYLDEKCALVGRIIEGKKKQIEILQEQRAAIINQAVTKGSDRNMEMKESGVEWIGKIPKKWEVRGLTKCLSSYADYRGKTPTKVDSGTFLVTARNIKHGFIDYEASQEYVLESEYTEIMGRGLPKKGDVLLTTEAPLGEVAQIDNENVALAQRVIKLRGKENFLSNEYLKFLLMSAKMQFGLYRLATGSTALGIKGSKLKQLYLFFPPYKDQILLVEHIKSKTGKVERRLAVIEESISLLNEYKISLIAHAVTGRVKVST